MPTVFKIRMAMYFNLYNLTRCFSLNLLFLLFYFDTILDYLSRYDVLNYLHHYKPELDSREAAAFSTL